MATARLGHLESHRRPKLHLDESPLINNKERQVFDIILTRTINYEKSRIEWTAKDEDGGWIAAIFWYKVPPRRHDILAERAWIEALNQYPGNVGIKSGTDDIISWHLYMAIFNG